jgi:hypothetical protein
MFKAMGSEESDEAEKDGGGEGLKGTGGSREHEQKR